ncbi:MAG: guanylate kinase [Anaerolineae bacterium]
MNKEYPDEFTSHPLLIVLSGPAGVGKDAVLRQLKSLCYPLHFVVTATDRPPRPEEIDGVDYHFVSTAEFQRMEREGELLEHALVYDQHKGVPRNQVREALAAGQDVIMRVDVQGAATVREIAPQAVLIFLTASDEDLEKRLRRRGTDSPEQLAIRLQKAREEKERISEFDYVVVNRDNQLKQAVRRVIAIIEAEHCRVHPRKVEL